MLISFLGKVSKYTENKDYKYKGEVLTENTKNYLRKIIRDLNESKILFILTKSLLEDDKEKEEIFKFINNFGLNLKCSFKSYLNYDSINKTFIIGNEIVEIDYEDNKNILEINKKFNNENNELKIFFICFDDEKDNGDEKKDDFEELYKNLNLKLEKHLENREKIHIDITHSYRYLPFITLQILELVKITKDIELGKILYAKEEESYYNLLLIDEIKELFEYQKAFQNFVELGSLEYLARLVKDEDLKNILINLDLALNLNFFNEIKEGFKALKNYIKGFDKYPLSIIRDNILDFLNKFNVDKVSKFQLELAKWHFKYRRLALGLIALEESIRSKHIENCEGEKYVFCFNCRTKVYNLKSKKDCRNIKNNQWKKYWCMLKNLRNIAGHNLGEDISQEQLKDYKCIHEEYIEFKEKLLDNKNFIEDLYKEVHFGRQHFLDNKKRKTYKCEDLCRKKNNLNNKEDCDDNKN